MSNDATSRVELLQGTLDMLIIRTLLGGPETGSLYPALHRLEAKGWIAACWELSTKGKRARFYRLTALGRRQLAAEQSKWDTFSRAMALILNPVDQEAQ